MWIAYLYLLVGCFAICSASSFRPRRQLLKENLPEVKANVPKLSAVMLTVAKDDYVFQRGISSAMKHLVDVDKFYIITPSKEELEKKHETLVSTGRVIFVAEQTFHVGGTNLTGELVHTTMYNYVKDRGQYPLRNESDPASRFSQFEHKMNQKIGWYLQQLFKIYAGRMLNLDTYVLLDGDCVWFRDVKFIADKQTSLTAPFKYNYASSTQIHGAYLATTTRIAGVPIITNFRNQKHKSGVVHHMVLVKEVLDDLFSAAEKLHGNKPMWKIMLSESAREMTCHSPKANVCSDGSTLSEYELYFNYAQAKFPQTVHHRPLLWTNGPRPGMLYWPDPDDVPTVALLSTDTMKYKWIGHKQSETIDIFERQMEADRLAGLTYVGYHGYAKRRYYELHHQDVVELCHGAAEPFNTSCSYRGLDRMEIRPDRTPEDWFRGCGCFMAQQTVGINVKR